MKSLFAMTVAVLLSQSAMATASADVDFVASANAFGLKNMQYVLEQNSGANVVYSPISADLALSMLLNGASQKTADEIGRTLNIPQSALTSVNRQILDLLKDLNSRPDGELKLTLANGMWVKKDLQVNPAYSALLRQYFQAEAAPLNSAAQINQWASDKTNGLISKIIDDVSSLEMILANATYFKADWTVPFSKARNAAFTALGAAAPAMVPMMEITEYTKYLRGNGFAAAELPYGKSKLASMIVVLPDSGLDFTAFRRQADAAWLNSITQELGKAQTVHLAVSIPKVTAATSFILNGSLMSMGMPTVFTNAADLSGISALPLKVSQVKQDAVIKIDEKGTEAAAVTSIGVAAASAIAAPPVRFTADHPFLYFIRDNKTGVVLFAGQVVKP